MKWSMSLRIATVAGIGIFVHWTFVLIIAWVVFVYLTLGRGLADIIEGVVFVLAIFACVVLHELGHALMARRYGIGTKDIILLPIGGVARLEQMPRDPVKEFWIAVAGPAVNVAIAAILYALLLALGALPEWGAANGPDNMQQFVEDLGFWYRLMLVNVFLVVFNMIPAFPMDGGRVLRAALATGMEYSRATRLAARIAQGIAVLFAVLALFVNPFLLLIALFVFLGAEAEAQSAEMHTAFSGLTARDAMLTHFHTLGENETLREAAEELLAGSQQDFPVTDADGNVVGVLPRSLLLKALTQSGLDASVSDAMRKDCPVVSADHDLEDIFQRMRQSGCQAIPVVSHGQLVGLITHENIGELVMIRSALRDRRTPGPIDSDPAAQPPNPPRDGF